MSSLSDRVAKALQTESTSDALVALIDDAQDELEAAEEACAEAQAKVLDPFSTTAAVTKAKRELEDQTLAAARLKTALGLLSGKVEKAREREDEAGRRKRYDDVVAERDAVIKEFQETYPEAAMKIATVLAKFKVIDDKLAKVNNDRPAGAAGLHFIERTLLTGLGWSFAEAVKLPALHGAEVPEPLRVAPGQVQFWPMSRGF
jgi:hypothetical protein